MKKTLLTMMLAGCLSSAEAYDYGYLVVQTASGSTASIATENLVLTVQDGTLVVKNSSTSTTYTLTDLSKMYFSSSSDATGIAEAYAGVDEKVDIYSSAGIFVGSFSSLDAARENLAKGVYIVKSKLSTTKIVAK